MYIYSSLAFNLSVVPLLDTPSRKALHSLGRNSVCVDVGANVGKVSKAFRFRGAVVHAVEPNPWAFQKLSALSRRDPLLHSYQFAASIRNSRETLFLHVEHPANPTRFSSGSSLLQKKPNVSDACVEVDGQDFAAFLKAIGPVDFLKIDVEGFEVELVPHLISSHALEKVSFIAVETHDKEKWQGLTEATRAMKEKVASAGLEHKFSWNWP